MYVSCKLEVATLLYLVMTGLIYKLSVQGKSSQLPANILLSLRHYLSYGR